MNDKELGCLPRRKRSVDSVHHFDIRLSVFFVFLRFFDSDVIVSAFIKIDIEFPSGYKISFA